MLGLVSGFFKKQEENSQMSSDDLAIQIKNVSKCFNIYESPLDRVKHLFMSNTTYHRKFWALNDVSFEVARGKAVGIIGQNGSGKSTLLQIITGVMTPTSGEVVTHGRIAALLELGSGFNPDFTGRENVYLNGRLLGLTTKQIEDKFDYIASFADIGDFLDQPTKTYSSGMMLRLAFAVQVAIETEILIIDEALAVGDARFQLKCFRRLEELKERGTTILFVSHATELVRSFCDYGLVLNKGKTIYWGDAKVATIKYLEVMFPERGKTKEKISQKQEIVMPEESDCLVVDSSNMAGHTFGTGGAEIQWMKIYGLDQPNILVGGRELVIQCSFTWDIDVVKDLIVADGYEHHISLGIVFADNKGKYLFGCNNFDSHTQIDCVKNHTCITELKFVLPHLLPGDYFITADIALGKLNHHTQLRWRDCIVHLQCVKTAKNIFGTFAIDYEMKNIS